MTCIAGSRNTEPMAGTSSARMSESLGLTWNFPNAGDSSEEDAEHVNLLLLAPFAVLLMILEVECL